MERARVFRTQGPVRILAGHTVLELFIIATAGFFTMHNMRGPLLARGAALIAAIVATSLVIRTVKFLLKPSAVPHFMAWLREREAYYPVADTNVLPLVGSEREEAS